MIKEQKIKNLLFKSKPKSNKDLKHQINIQEKTTLI